MERKSKVFKYRVYGSFSFADIEYLVSTIYMYFSDYEIEYFSIDNFMLCIVCIYDENFHDWFLSDFHGLDISIKEC